MDTPKRFQFSLLSLLSMVLITALFLYLNMKTWHVFPGKSHMNAFGDDYFGWPFTYCVVYGGLDGYGWTDAKVRYLVIAINAVVWLTVFYVTHFYIRKFENRRAESVHSGI